MNILKNELLSRHTTLRVGGPAQFFVEAKTGEDIREAVGFARENHAGILILGGGSNLWVSDEGFKGLALKVETRGMMRLASGGANEISEEYLENLVAEEEVVVVVEAGELWDDFVRWTVEQGLYGLENMSLIPGTVGGAVIGNIGAYGTEVKDGLVCVEALDMRTGAVRRFSKAECHFAYRHSFFKTTAGRNFIVLRACFALNPKGRPNLVYKDLKDYFAGKPEPTLAQMREAVVEIRTRKLPNLTQVGTAGSFFKNPVVPKEQYELLARRFPGLTGHDEGSGMMKVSLGWILDKVCGLKGVRRGAVGTHAAQALVLVNYGGTAAEVEGFAKSIAESVKEKTGLEIEWEVERV
jgi:UDP-N-acetylmuramate dehydrogenase